MDLRRCLAWKKLLCDKSPVDAHQIIILNEWIFVEGGESWDWIWIAIKLFEEVMIAEYQQALCSVVLQGL